MTLDATLRGILEQYIDEAIKGIPHLVHIHRQQPNPPEMNIKTIEDYILGFIQGLVMGQFISTYRAIYFQYPPPDISQEVGSIVFKRSAEIRETIFRQG